jgi:hypothetical protein
VRTTLCWLWSFRSWSKSLFRLNHSFHAIIHILYKIFFGTTESTFVRYVKYEVISLGVLAMRASDLNIKLISYSFELSHTLAKVR